jgi:hypothetical protein
MRKVNLIRLGALAQQKFNMKDGFEIIEFPADAGLYVRVAVPMSLGTVAYGPAAPFEYDDIQLEKVGIPVQGEFMWIGYSARANVLAIRESQLTMRAADLPKRGENSEVGNNSAGG